MCPCVYLHACGSRHSRLFERITNSKLLSETDWRSLCQSMSCNLSVSVMSYSGVYGAITNSGSRSTSLVGGGVQAMGQSPGHYSMQATARATGSPPTPRLRFTQMKTPNTATAIRYFGRICKTPWALCTMSCYQLAEYNNAGRNQLKTASSFEAVCLRSWIF